VVWENIVVVVAVSGEEVVANGASLALPDMVVLLISRGIAQWRKLVRRQVDEEGQSRLRRNTRHQ
jgi:non-canonical (house-cleaning) NTP pyrophosphatase